MEKIGIFGGTFNPIHNGHLITAQSVKEKRELSKIIFVPAFISPHKTENPQLIPDHRLRMLHLAIKDGSGFEVDDFELKQETVSYTIDSLKYFKQKYESIELIIGFDNLLVFDKWKQPDEILNLAELVVLNRKSDSSNSNKYFEKANFVETPIIEISSTEIRRRVNEGKSINYLVPQTVMEYIYDFRLYKD